MSTAEAVCPLRMCYPAETNQLQIPTCKRPKQLETDPT